MADLSIRNDFIEGVQEVFTTLLNEGVSDGIDLYFLSPNTKANVYGENKGKVYKQPIKLVAQARLNPVHGEQDTESVKQQAQFVVPLKDLNDKEVDVSTKGLEVLRRGVIGFHDTFYTIDNVTPKAYVEDVFLLYTFDCSEDLDMGRNGISVEEPPDEEGDLSE